MAGPAVFIVALLRPAEEEMEDEGPVMRCGRNDDDAAAPPPAPTREGPREGDEEARPRPERKVPTQPSTATTSRRALGSVVATRPPSTTSPNSCATMS